MSKLIKAEKAKQTAEKEPSVQEGAEKAGQKSSDKVKADTDDLLEEIDVLLENVGITFAAQYVQKGGQ